MKQQMVVTNLRMPQDEYLQIKSNAGELGMSFNEYVIKMFHNFTRQRMMNLYYSKNTISKKPIMQFIKEISNIPKKPMGLSGE